MRLAAALLLLAALALPAHARRVALVIGNDSYQHTEKLRNARNDASAMAQALEKAGFSVTRHQDLARDALFKAVDAFVTGVTKDDEVVFFYAGHGVQIDASPYLLPVDIRPDTPRQVTRDALSLDSVLADLGKARYTLALIDACRNNPFATQGTRSVGRERGLNPIEPPEGTAVMLAAGRGQAALDSLGPNDKQANGLFTRELIKHMATPGLPARELLLKVRDTVEQQAATVRHKQRPALIDESRGNFYFFAPVTVQVQPAPAKADAASIELAYWNSVQERGGVDELQLYLKRYPNGLFADLAQARVARLAGPAKPTAAAGDAEAQRYFLLAEKGNAPAFNQIGNFYLKGRHGLPTDTSAAVQWYERGVQAGDGAAMASLGWLYETGTGVPKDGARAFELYAKGAELGDARAMNNVGAAFSVGLGTGRDENAAVAWFVKSAALAHPRAMANLGRMHERGRGGLAADDAQAAQWYRKASDAGDPRGMSYLASFQYEGRGGIAKNAAAALELWRKSAELGDSRSMNALGNLYRQGHAGLRKDLAEARRWYERSAVLGNEDAQRHLQQLDARKP